MSKSTELDKKVKLYLLEAMRSHLAGYDFSSEDIEAMSPKEIADKTRCIFTNEYSWHLERYGVVRALTEWLQGLALPIDCYYGDIIDLAISWGSIPENATQKQKHKICDNYWSFMANKLSQLFDGYRVPQEVSA
jgi:hypothetical protein|tara:strand:+ start:42 stop:443 length:402 start_codon:yes stop_codon:yes gene_type:complete